MKRYMLISNGPCKVPLKSGKTDYILNIPQYRFNIAPSSERLMIYWLYQTRERGKFVEYLRSYSRTELTAKNIDDAVKQFQSDHVPVPESGFAYEDIPLMADPEKGLELPIPGYVCNISAEHETELLQMIVSEPYSITQNRIRHWFWRYCMDYGLDYNKKCKGEQYRYLAESFMEQHGISSLPEKPQLSAPKSSKGAMYYLIGPMIVMGWAGIVGLLIYCGNNMMSGEHPLIGALIAVIAFTLLGAPFISNKRK